MTMETESTEVEPIHRDAWILRRFFQKSNGVVAIDSLSLGLLGLSLLAMICCGLATIFGAWFVSARGFQAPIIHMAVWLLLLSPALAALSLLAVTIALRQGNMTIKLLTSQLLLFPSFLMTAALSLPMFAKTSPWWWTFDACLGVLAIALAIPASYVPTVFDPSLRNKRHLHPLFIKCFWIFIAVVWLSCSGNRAIVRQISPIWFLVVYLFHVVFTLGAASAIASVVIQMWNSWTIAESSDQSSEKSRMTIFSLMELTLVFAVCCSAIMTTPVEFNLVTLGATMAGVLSAILSRAWVKVRLNTREVRVRKRSLLVFAQGWLLLGGVISIAFTLRDGFSGIEYTVPLGIFIGLSTNLLFSGTVLLGIWWLRGCGWRLVTNSSANAS